MATESLYENIKAEMQLPQDVLTFYELFKKKNKDIFVVGGAVRDFIMGKTPHDFDLVTNALPDETKEILKDYRTDLQGEHFGVIRVYTEDEPLGYEIASYRKDISFGRDNKSEGEKVEIGKHITIEDDVLRRDFTQNALFYDIGKKEIIDLVGGVEDIKNNIIRAVGKPEERFKEDRLRIIRAIRFSARSNSKIDEQTSEAIRKDNRLRNVSSKEDVSQERIIDEIIKKMWDFCEKKNDIKAWQRYFKLLVEFDLLKEMFPNVKINNDVQYIETLNLQITFTTLFEDNEPTLNFEKTLIRDFKLSTKIVNNIIFLLIYLRNAGNVDNVFMLKKKQNQYNISNVIIKEYSDLNGIGKKFTDKFLEYELSISGEDVMADGFKGVDIGVEQKRRETEIFNNLLNENYIF
jgi:tRNA nucleotidyltransferase (CCA-adding enzyme)